MKLLRLMAFALSMTFVFTSCEKEDTASRYVTNVDNQLTASQVVPATNSTATGTISGTYDRRTRIFTYSVNWSGLSGNVTAIHIHGVADRGFMAIPVAPLAAYPNGIVQTNSVSGSNTSSGSFSGQLYVDRTAVREHDLLAGKFYVDIHTAAFPANSPRGEIRGQIIFP